MDIPQILQFIDETVYAKTNKHLNNLQRRIITGILKSQKYADISETYGYSAQHVKKASHELLQMLSDIFGEQVKKSNLESVLERQINQYVTNFGDKSTQNVIGIGCINLDSEKCSPNSEKIKSQTTNFQQQSQNQTKIETIDKLRNFGLSNEQIAEVLDIPLDVINQMELDE
ncbi:MAG: hypothetical protein WBV73_08015 [Phormidium sp.]